MPNQQKKNQNPPNSPEYLEMRGFLDIAAANPNGKKGVNKFTIAAYDGSPMMLENWYFPVVIDLEGLDSAKQIPILKDHSHKLDAVAGQSTDIRVENNTIFIDGELYTEDDEEVARLVAKSKKGYKWEASIGGVPLRREFIEDGHTVSVNGSEVTGPCYIARQFALKETSLVTIGACENTNVQINAKGKDEQMPNSNQTTAAPDGAAPVPPVNNNQQSEGVKASTPQPPAPVSAPGDDHAETIRAAAANEYKRQAEIKAACGDNDKLIAQAIAENWSVDRAKLEAIQATRPNAPFIQAKTAAFNAKALEAAARLHSSENQENVTKDYDEQTIEAADKFKSTSIRGFMEAACKLEGVETPMMSASADEWARAAFSTSTFSGILSNVAHKSMLASYRAVNEVAIISKIARKLTASDFKTHTGYRLTADTVFDALAAGGEIKHGSLGDSSFNYSVQTYGRMIGITREMMINDDLNAFAAIPQLIGRGAALKLVALFWNMIKDNVDDFFHANNNNINTDTLGVSAEGYDKATQLLEEMVDEQGNPILVNPKYVIVPPALHGAARRMFVSENLNVPVTGVGSAAKKSQIGEANSYKGLYEPIVARALKDKPAEYYLFGNPADVAAFGVAYLRGNETPTIEEVDLPAEYLGKAWRGYFDVGVTPIDPRGAVKMS